jgi:hypothetical protein
LKCLFAFTWLAAFGFGTGGAVCGPAVPIPKPQSAEVTVAPPPKPAAQVSRSSPGTKADAPPEKPAPETMSCPDLRAGFEAAPPVAGNNGCGFQAAVRLKVIGGDRQIAFAQEPVLNCGFADAVADWIAIDVNAAATKVLGEELVAVHSGPGYQCRRRNNKPDGKLSEHALGNAIDVTAFEMSSGTLVSVEIDWQAPDEETAPAGRFLRAVHAAACARFTTVLGPEADEHHISHFHLDNGCHGKDCTYLICQ